MVEGLVFKKTDGIHFYTDGSRLDGRTCLGYFCRKLGVDVFAAI